MGKKMLAFSLTMIFVGSVFAQTKADPTIPNVIANLNRIESLYFKYLNQREQQEAVRLMNETRGMIVGSGLVSPTEDQGANSNVLSDEAFFALLANVRGEVSDSSKTKLVLGSLGNKGKLYMRQIEKLIQVYTFDDDKKNLLMGAYKNIVDPVNISTVLQFFRSSFTRDDVLKFYQQQ